MLLTVPDNASPQSSLVTKEGSHYSNPFSAEGLDPSIEIGFTAGLELGSSQKLCLDPLPRRSGRESFLLSAADDLLA